MADAAPMFSPQAPTSRFSVTPAIELAVLAGAVAIAVATYFIIASGGSAPAMLSPVTVATLLVVNLVPGIALLVLLGRRIAMRRAARSPIGGRGQLHVRLVALFSMLAAVPTLLVVIFASFLFQFGVEFWYSGRAQGMVENAQTLAHESYNEMLSYVDNENLAMAQDLSRAINQYHLTIEDRRFQALYGQDVYQRSLAESVIFSVSKTGEIHAEALVNPYERDLDRAIEHGAIDQLRQGKVSVASTSSQRTTSITQIPNTSLFLYSARITGAEQMTARMHRAQAVISDYQALLTRSRSLQLRFNAALLGVSLLIVGIAVWIALAVADRLVRPVGELVAAAHRIATGDLSARVPQPQSDDEVGTLANAFNQMTVRLQQQTGALESRRALIEAVMSGVTAGVIAIAADGSRIRLINPSASLLLQTGEKNLVGENLVGRPLAEISPELGALIEGDTREAIVEIGAEGDRRTLAVKIAHAAEGPILTFDDITGQLLDQRRAAWSDVARRIAHEIKNPLTPIQLAAERLQRRYGRQLVNDDGTFARLTETIVRQVGDLRRMVDEFSSFARMPKPMFREESLLDIARQALFLHEVAHPGVIFALEHDDSGPGLVCDRRQIGQALTNLVKNAVEAIEARGEGAPGAVTMTLAEQGHFVTVTVADNGVGLPAARDRLVEPYVTTRARGTGLGLAIVKKIVEEHCGTIAFGDAPGGGTLVTMRFDVNALAATDRGDPSSNDGDDRRFPELTRNRI